MDPLIVGAGPAGSAAAITLARGGARPMIFEQEAATGDSICGGFLSWRTLNSLRALGVDPDSLGGRRVTRLRLFAGKAMAESSLPRPGLGLSRRRLDQLMLDHALERGARIERGKRLTRIDRDGATHFGDEINYPSALFVAAGKHNVRGLHRIAPSIGDPALGLRVRLGPDPALETLVGDSIELHLFDRGYAGLVLHEDGTANLCLAVRKSRFQDSGGAPAWLFDELGCEPALAERLAFLDSKAPVDAIGSVPYGWLVADTIPGRFLLGDQAACIPSLAGEGIGLAIASAVRAASWWLADGPAGAPSYQREFARAAHRPMAVASTLWRLAERPGVARAAVHATHVAPWLARLAARLTRIPA